jgi:hypothetical protein
MKIVAALLARKQQLLDRLQENPDPHERDEIDRLLAQINRALDYLDQPGPDEATSPRYARAKNHAG